MLESAPLRAFGETKSLTDLLLEDLCVGSDMMHDYLFVEMEPCGILTVLLQSQILQALFRSHELAILSIQMSTCS